MPFGFAQLHPSDWPHLGYKWLDQYFVDIRLPFGSRSSPFIFNQFAEALLWILIFVFGIPHIIHYLDDFFLSALSFDECKKDMATMKFAFSELGVPLASDKVIGPATVMTYLGIEIDSVSSTIRLPSEKFQDLCTLLQHWEARKKCTKRELLSLIQNRSFQDRLHNSYRFN